MTKNTKAIIHAGVAAVLAAAAQGLADGSIPLPSDLRWLSVLIVPVLVAVSPFFKLGHDKKE